MRQHKASIPSPICKANGLEAMEYAEQHMPVLRDTMDSPHHSRRFLRHPYCRLSDTGAKDRDSAAQA